MRHLLDSKSLSTGMATHHMSKDHLLVIIFASITAFLLVIGISLFLWWAIRARKRRRNESSMKIWTNQLSTMHPGQYNDAEDTWKGSGKFEATKFRPWPDTKSRAPGCLAYSLLQAATNNFSSSNLLGEGSFGLVYRARLDDDDYVAVKRLTREEHYSLKEFQGEVELMSKMRHPNLVALLGYSRDGPEPLVVYELMQNGSLHDQLHGPSCGTALTWSLRLKIALEAARGLEHLHEDCKPAIIHRDFKASNILLDASFNAKVSDFGSAVALEDSGLLKGETPVQGTFGYIAPEYLLEGKLTVKSDVYGFGVVLLELLSGRSPIDTSLPLGSQSLVTWATPLITNRAKLMECLDPSLQDTVNEKHLHQVAAVAVLCVQSEPSYRPLMTDVVQSLLPLVPQELGGALREYPKGKSSNSKSSEVSTKVFKGFAAAADHQQTSDFEFEVYQLHVVDYSERSDSSLSESLRRWESLPKSSSSLSSGPLDRSRPWEDHTLRSYYLDHQNSSDGHDT